MRTVTPDADDLAIDARRSRHAPIRDARALAFAVVGLLLRIFGSERGAILGSFYERGIGNLMTWYQHAAYDHGKERDETHVHADRLCSRFWRGHPQPRENAILHDIAQALRRATDARVTELLPLLVHQARQLLEEQRAGPERLDAMVDAAVKEASDRRTT